MLKLVLNHPIYLQIFKRLMSKVPWFNILDTWELALNEAALAVKYK